MRLKLPGRVLAFALAAAFAGLALACGGSKDNTSTNTNTANANTITTTTGTTATTASNTTTGGGATGSPGLLDITATEYSFTAPASVPGGLVKISFKNNGKQAHGAQLARLNPGVTQAQILTALQDQANPAGVLSLLTTTGGVNTLPAGASQEAYDNLDPGSYLIVSFGGEDQPDFMQGMIKTLTVGTAGIAPAAPPSNTTKVTLADYNFLGVDSLKAGQATTLQVVNGGPQTHELAIFKLAAGFTADQFKALIASNEEPPAGSGPPPFSEAGGLGALANGATGYATVNLAAGNYVFVCFIPDKANGGAPHAALGMVKGVTVQ